MDACHPSLTGSNYHNAVDRVGSGLPLFDPRQLVGPYLMPDVTLTGYTYPPSSVVVFAPFAGGLVGLALWVTLNLTVFMTGLWAALRRDLGDRTPIAFSLVLAGLVLTYLPLVSGVVSGNVNLAIVGLYAWCWALGRSKSRIGLFVGIAAMLKIYPIILLLWPTGRSRPRSVILAAGAMVGLVALSLPWLGVGAWPEFLTAFSNAELSCGGSRFSLQCLLEPSLGLTAAKAVALGLAVILMIAAARTTQDRLAFVLLGAAMLVAVPDMHPHYWLIAYVALMVVLAGAARQRLTVDAAARPG